MSDVLVARVGAPHGVRGEVRVKPFTQEPLAIREYGPLHDEAGRPFVVSSARPQKTMLVVSFKGISSREEAEALNGTKLFVARSALPEPAEDEFYAVDLVGMDVFEEGTNVGRVRAVEDFGAGDVLEIQGPVETFWLDFTRGNVPAVEIEGRRIEIVRPPETSERE